MNDDNNNFRDPQEPEERGEPPRQDLRGQDDLDAFEEYERRWSSAVENRAEAYSRQEQEDNSLIGRMRRRSRARRAERFEREREAEQIEFVIPEDDLDYVDTRSVKGLRHRRRMHRDFGYSCLAAILYAAFILGVSMFCAGFIIMCANEVFAFVKPDVSAVVEIDEQDSYAEVAEKLKDGGVISHPWLFRLYCRVSNPKFRTGKFELSANLDYNALERAMTRVSTYRETVWVTIPEGYTAQQIAEELAKKKVCTADDFLKAVENGDFDYDFLPETDENVKVRLEGYLFPDTYQFYVDDDPANVIKKFLNNFSVRFTDKLARRAEEMGLEIDEIITIASMIEREAKRDTERPIVASVIFNRLNNSANFPYLQIDATVAYLVGRAPTAEDLELDDPYNTYVARGLPPGPISNPGIDAITAVLYAEDTDYYYYVARADGSHIFSRTYEEHLRAIEEAQATFNN